ncbi:MAG: hypothetical protein LBH96_06765 [Candidatus Peribacteria bacterium]|jgi:gas vesicle protein|nr:hypothetical protein [Candidatus Peribacteria bacterium]
MNIDTMMYSGKDILSETWETTKEAGKEYYEEQVKPFVDTAKEEIIDKANQIKNQYNQEVEKINETIQEQANQVKDQVNKLKVE